jgi:hypothetical protein
MKLLRTIRLDPSDTFVFPAAAEPGEWAVAGTFMFSTVDPATLEGKERIAFRGGFLGVPSFGWSTLVQIVEVDAHDRSAAIDMLAQCLYERRGAPDIKTARAAAEEEINFSSSLCNHPQDTLIALQRACKDGEIRETFRTLRPRGDLNPSRVFSFLEVEDEHESPEPIDLSTLARGGGR